MNSLQQVATKFVRAKKTRQKWAKVEDEREGEMMKMVTLQVQKEIEQGNSEHILTVQEWDSPRPSWDSRTWNNPGSTTRKVTFICSCGEEIGTVSPGGALTKINDCLERHLKRSILKSVGAKE